MNKKSTIWNPIIYRMYAINSHSDNNLVKFHKTLQEIHEDDIKTNCAPTIFAPTANYKI